MSDDYFTLDSLLVESEISESAVVLPLAPPANDDTPKVTNTRPATPKSAQSSYSVHSGAHSVKSLYSAPGSAPQSAHQSAPNSAHLSSHSKPSTAGTKSQPTSRPFSSLIRSLAPGVTDIFSVESFSDLLERVIDKLNLKPTSIDTTEQERANQLSLDIKVKTQKSVIDELSNQIKDMRQKLKETSEQLAFANTEIQRLEDQKDIDESTAVHEKRSVQNQRMSFEQETIELIEQLKQQSREAATQRKQSNHTEEFLQAPEARAEQGMNTEQPGQVDQDKVTEQEDQEPEQADHGPTRSEKSLNFEEKAEEHVNDYQDYEGERRVSYMQDDYDDQDDPRMPGPTKITKEMIQETARMIAVAKNYDPPSTLEVGLKTNQKAPTNPYQHLIKNPYQLDATTFRVSSNVPTLARHAFNHKNHLSTVLARQTHELLSTTTPDQYIRVLHHQLQSMLEALHDCIDALAEESRNADRWRVRFDKYKRQIEQRDEYIRTHKDFNQKFQDKQLRLLNELFPSVKKTNLEEPSAHNNIVKKRTTIKIPEISTVEIKDIASKSHSRPKYIPPIL